MKMTDCDSTKETIVSSTTCCSRLFAATAAAAEEPKAANWRDKIAATKQGEPPSWVCARAPPAVGWRRQVVL